MKTDWCQTIANNMNGTMTGTVRQITTSQTYVGNRLLTATSEKEYKFCANSERSTKGGPDTGVLKGIAQAVTNIWNKSMTVSPIGKIFMDKSNNTKLGIGSTVMEITQKVIQEQKAQRKKQEEQNEGNVKKGSNSELSSGVALYFDQGHITEK